MTNHFENQTIGDIASRILDVPTLAERGRDFLDFHTIGVVQIEKALRAAYEAGKRDAGNVVHETTGDMLCYRDGDTTKTFWRTSSVRGGHCSYWVNRNGERYGRIFSADASRFSPAPRFELELEEASS
tara:strand:+ start:10889 stop:11272 length:384 start_codon:yes stop_codon:yes gene_type:complete